MIGLIFQIAKVIGIFQSSRDQYNRVWFTQNPRINHFTPHTSKQNKNSGRSMPKQLVIDACYSIRYNWNNKQLLLFTNCLKMVLLFWSSKKNADAKPWFETLFLQRSNKQSIHHFCDRPNRYAFHANYMRARIFRFSSLDVAVHQFDRFR